MKRKSRRCTTSTSSSSEDDIRMRKGAVRKIELNDSPVAAGFREWVQHVYVRVTVALKRSKTRTLKWLQMVARCDNVAKLDDASRRLDVLGKALA